MQVSKNEVSKKVERKIYGSLYQVLADMRRADQVERFFEDVLSETEKTVLAKRLGIAMYLSKGKSYDKIRNDLQVSSATIATVQKWLEQRGEGLKLAIKAIEADEWADEWTEKINESIKKVFKRY